MTAAADGSYRQAYERHWDDVFRFLLAWTNDWSAAEDLTQEAYVRLWRNRERVDWDRPIVAWLLVTGRRLAASRYQRLRRVVHATHFDESWDEAARIRWMDVRQSLGRLTKTERTALLLTAVEGWSYAEVAQAVGTSDGALRAAVSRARAKLEV